MAKKSITSTEYRRMLAARQGRAGGKFLPLSPEQKMGYRAPAPAVGVSSPQETTVGLIEALLQQRQSMGYGGSSLEKYVIGGDGAGVRSQINAYIRQNQGDFDPKDPAGAAAYELLQEAANLSEESLKASTVDAKQILKKIQFLRNVAQKTRGRQSAVANELQRIIAPVEAQLLKRASFSEYVKDQISNFRRTLPERLLARIPLVGKFFAGFLQQRRTATEELERYSERLGERISERSGTYSLPKMSGGTRASEIPGLGGNTDQADYGKGTVATLGAIYKEVVKIRTMMESKQTPESDTAELRARESELESRKLAEKAKQMGATPIAGKGGEGFLSSLLSNSLGSALGSALGSFLGSLGPTLIGALTKLGPLLLGALAGIGKTLVAGIVAAVGAAIGAGLAWLVNSGVDAIFGTHLAEAMGQLDTYTFGDAFRDAKHEAAEKRAQEKLERETSTKEYIANQSQDIRRLPRLVLDKKLSGAEAIDLLSVHERAYGVNADTERIRQSIKASAALVDPNMSPEQKAAAINSARSAVSSALIPSPISVNTTNNSNAAVVSTTSANTTVGRTISQYSNEREALALAKTEMEYTKAGTGSTPTINNQSVHNNMRTVVNNYNDDLRIRDNEATLKQMQRESISR